MSRLKIAFVASGGAARGLAHLGVLKACEELGIHPEIYVGTGTGALVGATYGQDIPLDVLLDAYRLPWRRRHSGPRMHVTTFLGLPSARDLLDPKYLLSGAFSLEKLERYVGGTLPINDFAKLPQQVFITAVDIDSAQRVVFGPGYEEGVSISRAVAAAQCVPGVFRPFRIGDRYYVSGEVAKTLSADEAIAAGADVLLDDRDERAGVLLNDSELLGIPHRIVIGDRALKEGNVEYAERRAGEPQSVPVGEVVEKVLAAINAE